MAEGSHLFRGGESHIKCQNRSQNFNFNCSISILGAAISCGNYCMRSLAIECKAIGLLGHSSLLYE